MIRRWIIYVDLDGTLLNSHLVVSERSRTALRAAESSAHIVLTSGRPASSCIGMASDLLVAPRLVIASNGGAVIECNSYRVVAAAQFGPGVAASVASIARFAEVALCIYHPLEWYVGEDHARTALEVRRSGSRPRIVSTPEDYLGGAVKLMMIGPPKVVAHLRTIVEGLTGVSAFITYPEYLEVMPAAFTKATAARTAKEFLCGHDETRTMAIGDGVADLALFTFVDEPIAMANASEPIRQAAKYIAPSNDDDGVAVAIEAMLLGVETSRVALLQSNSSP